MKKLFFASIFLLIFLQFEPLTSRAQSKMENDFVHTVLFWFHEPNNETHQKKFEESLSRFMENSNYVQSYHIGTPAGTPRKVVDNSYTYKLVVTFKSRENQDKYQQEDVHRRFIKESEQYWKKVSVFDSISIN